MLGVSIKQSKKCQIHRRGFFDVTKAKKTGWELNEHRWKNWSAPITFKKLKETNLVKHLTHLPTDSDKMIEMEKYRISMRHLAAMMGEDPKTFTLEKQQKAIRYLLPGYSLYGEATPRVVHPSISMDEYTTEENHATRLKHAVEQGRPLNQKYWEGRVKTKNQMDEIDLLRELNQITSWLKNKEGDIINRRIRGELSDKEVEILLTGDVTCYFTDFIKKYQAEKWSTKQFRDELAKVSESAEKWPRSLIMSESYRINLPDLEWEILSQMCLSHNPNNQILNLPVEKELTDGVKFELARLENSHLSGFVSLDKIISKESASSDDQDRDDISDKYFSQIVPHVNVLGIDFYNRECSTSTGHASVTNTVNVTVIKNGTGLFDVNGTKLQQFFRHEPAPIMKALAPFSLLQQLKSFDMIIGVTGMGGGQIATYMGKGADFPRPTYGVYNHKGYPYKGANPLFGQGPDHHTALNNGGMKIAKLIARGACEALMPLVEEEERDLLIKSGLMIPDIRQNERTWTSGAGTLRIKGRRTKKWRKR